MVFISIFRSDVWAFGILMFEILTIGENPYRYSNVKNRDYKERLKKEFEWVLSLEVFLPTEISLYVIHFSHQGIQQVREKGWMGSSVQGSSAGQWIPAWNLSSSRRQQERFQSCHQGKRVDTDIIFFMIFLMTSRWWKAAGILSLLTDPLSEI